MCAEQWLNMQGTFSFFLQSQLFKRNRNLGIAGRIGGDFIRCGIKNNAVFTEIIVVNKIRFVIQCFFRILKEAFRIALYLLLEQAAYLLVQFFFGNADEGSQRGFLTRCLVKEVISPARHTMCAAS